MPGPELNLLYPRPLDLSFLVPAQPTSPPEQGVDVGKREERVAGRRVMPMHLEDCGSCQAWPALGVKLTSN